MVAPARSRRPGVPSGAELADDPSGPCPFCAGNESETPPETFALADAARAANTAGWRVRVVPNLYPAFVDPAPEPPDVGPFEVLPARGRQEVVVHVPRHALTVANLTPAELADVAAAWRDRAVAARRAGFDYLHVLVNEGRAAGASRAHTHSQLVWLPAVPPAHTVEGTGGRRCALCALLTSERQDGRRVVAELDGIVVAVPIASVAPYELLIAPATCEGDAFASHALEPSLEALSASIRRLRHLVPAAPLNAWLHTSALGEVEGHWHLHVLPRLTVMAGLELGAGLFVNPLPPEEAAALLRSAPDI